MSFFSFFHECTHILVIHAQYCVRLPIIGVKFIGVPVHQSNIHVVTFNWVTKKFPMLVIWVTIYYIQNYYILRYFLQMFSNFLVSIISF